MLKSNQYLKFTKDKIQRRCQRLIIYFIINLITMIGRNDKCHCGSGKKYKKCCLDTDKKKSFELDRIIKFKKSYLNTCTNVMSYASQREDFKEIMSEASALFFPKKMECPKDVLPVFNTFLIKDFLLKDNKSNLILDYHNKFRKELSSLEVNVLYNIAISYTSLYVVESINGYKITLKDLFTDKTIEVQDDVLGGVLSINSVYIANIIKVGNVNILTDILFEITAKNVLENLVCDVVDIYNNYKDEYDSREDFLRRNCLLFYYHILQIISPETVEEFERMVNESISSKVANEEQNLEEDNKGIDLKEENTYNLQFTEEVIEKIDLNLKDKVLEMLDSCLDKESFSKISEPGWISATEYHLKKESGENITQAQIAKKYNISSSTVGKRYKIVKEFSK